ncbi:MAG: ketoacyl-ACP synthase III [Selenomonadaceae bacterium]|nr:ketoacyl-ACP synthase III [Selenomonadaceae bacterium]
MLGVVSGIKLSHVASIVSKNRMSIEERCAHLLTPKQAARLARGTGFKRLSIAPSEVCTSDLCYRAATELFDRGLVKREEIGALLFISEYPDYPVPATAFILQGRLGLPHDIIALDINLGCPGFAYGIYLASMLLSNMERKVMMCFGGTSSRDRWKDDTSMLPLFGDGGAVAIVEKTEGGGVNAFYNIDSYGERYDALITRRGGSRANKITDLEGNLIETERSNYEVMDGMAIMDFSLKEAPDNIEKLIEYAGITKADIDISLFHQANRMIVEALADKLKIEREKAPFKCEDIGNTTSASIPICMTELKSRGEFGSFKTALISGYGVGLAVSSAVLDLSETNVLETLQYE